MTFDSRQVATAQLHDLLVGPAFARFLAGWLAGHVVSPSGHRWMAELVAREKYVLSPLCQL